MLAASCDEPDDDMALFRFTTSEPEPVLHGEGLTLRPPVLDDYAAWAALRAESRAFLQPWEPIWPADDLTRIAFRRRLKRYGEELREDSAYPFLIFRAADSRLVGGLTLGLVRRGVAQTCTMGYWIGAPYAHQGHMTRAVRLALRFAFGRLGLRRVEAASIPENAASIGLLEKVGFVREGLAREYLCIAGRWRDHALFALLASEFEAREKDAGGRR
jgi:ribosomal-protein-alanine N-acetyltransferase